MVRASGFDALGTTTVTVVHSIRPRAVDPDRGLTYYQVRQARRQYDDASDFGWRREAHRALASFTLTGKMFGLDVPAKSAAREFGRRSA